MKHDSGGRIFYSALLIYVVTGILLVFLLTVQSDIPQRDLKGIPLSIHGWTGTDIPLADDVIAMIQPDYYIFRDYRKNDEVINLYVAFYKTVEKSDLAHSPMICYQSQGWTIDDKRNESILRAGEQSRLNLSRLVVEKGSRTEFVYFWYQTRNYSAAGLASMRMRMIINWFSVRDRLNSFVRVSCGCTDSDCGEAERLTREFIRHLGQYIDANFE